MVVGQSRTKTWLSNPGNLITLVLFIVTMGTSGYNAFSSRDSQLVRSLELSRQNAEQLELLAARVDVLREVVNRHVTWSEGRSVNLDELRRRVERLEALSDGRR